MCRCVSIHHAILGLHGGGGDGGDGSTSTNKSAATTAIRVGHNMDGTTVARAVLGGCGAESGRRPLARCGMD